MANEFNELLEAFNDFNLREAAFDLDKEGAEEYFDFVDDDYEDDELEVVDVEAKDEEEVGEEDYIDDIALQCKTCHGIILKKEDEVKTEEDKSLADVTEEDIVNIEEECPLCNSKTGFCVLGKIVPYVNVDIDVEEEGEEEKHPNIDEFFDVEVDAHEFGGTGNDVDVLSPGKLMPDADAVTESKECKDGEKCDEEKELQEAVNKFAGINEEAKVELDAEEGSANVEIDNTKVDIDTQKDEDELGIAPIEADDVEFEEDELDDAEFDDIDISDIEEESLEMAYVKAKPFCEKFRVRDVYHNRGKIVVEGIAKLRNGDRARTRFSLTPRHLKGDKASFVVEGLGTRDRCFGKLKNGEIMVESFKASKKQRDKK